MTSQYDILANEARKQELRIKLARLRGSMDATSSVMSRLSSLNNDAALQVSEAQEQLSAIELGAGPGITDSFGSKSTVTRLLETEREAAKSACVDFVKANPGCSEVEAANAWDVAALASHPDVPCVLQPGMAMGTLYRLNLVAGNFISENTWEAQRAWVLSTPKDVIMVS